ncbi:hypothetical protein EDC01DRAFT_635207 [Geopyxis carbonaria]|nr:hypothetical protein EDC01DRAFT_635207 [Geopyxis carbonaria]
MPSPIRRRRKRSPTSALPRPKSKNARILKELVNPPEPNDSSPIPPHVHPDLNSLFQSAQRLKHSTPTTQGTFPADHYTRPPRLMADPAAVPNSKRTKMDPAAAKNPYEFTPIERKSVTSYTRAQLDHTIRDRCARIMCIRVANDHPNTTPKVVTYGESVIERLRRDLCALYQGVQILERAELRAKYPELKIAVREAGLMY